MRIIAFSTDGPTVRDLLGHLGEPTAPPRIAPARTCRNTRAEPPVATESGRLIRPSGFSTFKFARLNLLSVAVPARVVLPDVIR